MAAKGCSDYRSRKDDGKIYSIEFIGFFSETNAEEGCNCMLFNDEYFNSFKKTFPDKYFFSEHFGALRGKVFHSAQEVEDYFALIEQFCTGERNFDSAKEFDNFVAL